MNNPIQFFWHGKEFSLIEILSLSSFIKNGHTVHLYTYDPIEKVPDEVEIKDANEIIDKEYLFKVNNGYALFADWFRFELLLAKGGVWSDLDVICLKELNFESDNFICGERTGIYSTGIIGLNKSHSLASRMVQRVENAHKYLEPADLISKILSRFGMKFSRNLKLKNKPTEIYTRVPWGKIAGPMGFTEEFSNIPDQSSFIRLLPEAFYPISYKNWWSVFYDDKLNPETILKNSFGIHLWANMFSEYSKFSKNGPFVQNTIFDFLLKKYH